MKRLPFVRGDVVAYQGKGDICPPNQGELGIIDEDSCDCGKHDYSVLWAKHGWQAWFDSKELKFVSSRTFKTLRKLKKQRNVF